jgi:hypothetical protein
MSEIVYILTNESMPGYIKIGFTTCPIEGRLKQLDRTGVPLPFEVYYAATVQNAEIEEKWLHSIFADRRVRSSREFFKMNPEYAALALKRVEIREELVVRQVTKEQESEIEESKNRRSRFHFKNYEIPIGATINFTRDENIKAIVLENDKIQVNENIGSLSKIASDLLKYKMQVQGTLYFKFDGEILDDRRKRMDLEREGVDSM